MWACINGAMLCDMDRFADFGHFPDQLHLAPLSAVVQLRPQLHHLDAYDEVTVKSKSAKSKQDEGETEARAIDMKVKSAEGDTGGQSNNELLKKMQDEKWEKYQWIDENVRIALLNMVFPSVPVFPWLTLSSVT